MIKNDKPTLVIIIILLLIFIPLSIYGGYLLLNDESSEINDGKILEFYEGNEVIASYQCISENCDYVKSSEEIILYESNIGTDNILPVVNNSVFVYDENKIILYNILNNINIIEFEEIKFYNLNNNNNLLFAKKDGKWGAISLDNLSLVIPYEYDYIGLSNMLDNDLLNSNNILVQNNNEYYIIDVNNNIISDKFNDLIINYNENYIFTKDNFINIFDYNNNQIFVHEDIHDIVLQDDYMAIVIDENIYIYELSDNNLINFIDFLTMESYETIDLVINNNNIELYIDDFLINSFELLN